MRNVVVWGTGNVGRPAVRAVLAHHELNLVGLVVSSPDKVGRDAGYIAGVDPVGVAATNDWQSLLAAGGIDAIVYTATSDIRPEEAFTELLACLGAGIDVVSTSFYPLLYPACGVPEAVDVVEAAAKQGGSSVFVSGIDPGWAQDMLPLVISGLVSDISEIRMRENFNYALYDQPQVVREICGFGGPMDQTPVMLHEASLRLVWEPMIQVLAAGLGREVVSVEVVVERLPLETDVETDTMGHFAAGTQGAFRFEVRGNLSDEVVLVVEHVTRIHSSCAPDWPSPPEGEGCHQLIIEGNPRLVLDIHGEDPVEPGPAGGGNCTAANRIVNAVPAVCDAAPGILTMLDLPLIHGGPQLRESGIG